MVDFDRAYSDVIDLLEDRPKSKNPICFKMHKTTNENLTAILGQFDFEGKEVLSVLSSSDQMMSSYYLGAKEVDTFDNNVTPYLFYYLKKWCMEYTGKSYLSASNIELLECLDLHQNNDIENNVALFWKRVLLRISVPLTHSALFYTNFSDSYGVPYSDNIAKMNELMKDKDPNYSRLDLFDEQDIERQYDYIILSNILEYAYEEDDVRIYQNIMRNIHSALKDDGVVICSSLIFENILESGYFEEMFDTHEGAYEYEEHRKRYKPISYSYTKKRRIR